MDRRRSSHIIPEIYEATLETGHWNYVLAMIAKLTKSKTACLYYKNRELNFTDTVAQYGMPVDMSLNIGGYLEKLDSLFDQQNSNNSSISSYEMYSPDSHRTVAESTEFYNSWMKPNDIYYIAGGHFIDEPTHKASLAILRSKQDGVWGKGDIRVLDEILPHLKRALNIYSEFTLLKTKQDALLKSLDRLVIGLILYDKYARVVYTNPTAESIIKNHPALQIHGDNLLLANPDEDRNLRQIIVDTAEIDPDDSWKQSVAIGVTHPNYDSPLPLLVTPMHAQLIPSEFDYEGAKVAVFISDPDLKHPISVDSLISVYGLTRSEAQVAISLVNGHKIEEIAKSSNHSTHTIRSQLKSVFRKVGVSRQSDLVKVLLTGPLAQRRKSN